MDLAPQRVSSLIKEVSLRKTHSLQDHRLGYICLNKYMFKVGVHVPFEHGIVKLLYVLHRLLTLEVFAFSEANVGPYDLRGEAEHQDYQQSPQFNAGVEDDVVRGGAGGAENELEDGTRVLPVPQSWVVRVEGGEAEACRLGEASSSLAGLGPSTEESLAVALCQSGQQAHKEKCPKKKMPPSGGDRVSNLWVALFSLCFINRPQGPGIDNVSRGGLEAGEEGGGRSSNSDACRSGIAVLLSETPVKHVQVMGIEDVCLGSCIGSWAGIIRSSLKGGGPSSR
ncbi:hypothetical protein ACLOJK_013110 [Asimina triloba]